MSCGCSPIKKNVNEAGVFGLSKLAMIKKSKGNKKEILQDSGIVLLSGFIYDSYLKAMADDLPMVILPAELLKPVYQLLILGGANFVIGRKGEKMFDLWQLLENSLSILIATYGLGMIDDVYKSNSSPQV